MVLRYGRTSNKKRTIKKPSRFQTISSDEALRKRSKDHKRIKQKHRDEVERDITEFQNILANETSGSEIYSTDTEDSTNACQAEQRSELLPDSTQYATNIVSTPLQIPHQSIPNEPTPNQPTLNQPSVNQSILNQTAITYIVLYIIKNIYRKLFNIVYL